MKRPNRLAWVCCCCVLAWGLSAVAADLPADWQREQRFDVPAPGLIKLSLPVQTLDAARPSLEDLRLYDNVGNELPYLVERPAPASKVTQAARSFNVTLNPGTTAITFETGLEQALDALTLETLASSFIKSVQIDGSTDGQGWQTLSRGQPIFRQPDGATQLRLAIPPKAWRWLRLVVDDARSEPIPFTGAFVHAATPEATPSEPLSVSISERHENPGETRFTLNLGAANMNVAAIQIETTEPLFMRQVTLAVPQISEDSIREQTVGQGVVYRVAIDGQPVSANLSVPLETQIGSRDLVLLIRNQDSPPLSVTAVRAERRLVYLVFLARAAGVHHLLTGNSRCPAPRYDLAGLGANLKNSTVSPIQLSPPAANPNYREPEVLPGIQDEGPPLDVAEWKFRKAIKLARDGPQLLELDLDALAHTQAGFQDSRLLRDTRQVPYILERTSISRALVPTVATTDDAKDKSLSRWIIKLPRFNLPVSRLSCVTRTALFQREVTLYEEAADERGARYRRPLGSASWVQTPGRTSPEFVLAFSSPPQSDTLFLETHNADNPPIELEKFQLFYPVVRLLFKAKPEDALFLYYGNPRAVSPRYDLSLAASQLLGADKASASLGAEEQLRESSWSEGRTPGQGGVIFWGILALVVVVLLAIISRLLPKSPPPG